MNYPSIRIEGAILSPDILERIDDAQGQRPVDFGLDASAKVKDEILRVWADAQHYWSAFQRKLESIKTDSPATTETRSLWMVPLLTLLGYQLEYQARGTEVNGKNYPISHRVVNRNNTALHIAGYQEPSGLDKKPEKMALRMSAHAMVQEYLNLDEQLYGIVTNGRILRLLRDSSRLVKLTYLEFDLDRIFTDGLFADFAVLFRLLHASRLPQTDVPSSSCWLERYHQETIEQGTRIRDGLRDAVTEALEILGTGFLGHPDNAALLQRVKSGEMRPDIYFSHILRLVYRLLFLMVIEERGLVFPKDVPRKNITLYFDHYSVQRLRRLAVTRGLKVERFHDGWLSLLSTFQLFESPAKAAKIGTTVLGGQLFNPDSLGPLAQSRVTNAALFAALDRLCYFEHPKTKQRTPVNFGALATEEFGSVYESLLELHPVAETEPTRHFGFRQVAGNERKTTGSYYTATSLVTCLLDSALDPVLEDRIKNFKSLGFKSVDEAVLALNVCDPACGSGHFLIAAAQRIARRLAFLRAGDEEPSPELLRHTLREVIGNCIHGVDVNPMSVELCKVALWLEAVEPGKPLNFLDHHIKCGNSLLGATPECIRDGIPDEAYQPITGDDKEAARWMRKLNKDAREGQTRFDFSDAKPWDRLGNLPAAMATLEVLEDETPEALRAKEKLYYEIVAGASYESARLLHDTWCAAFVWPKLTKEYGTELTTDHLRIIERNPHRVEPNLKKKIRELAGQYRFFHWHLEFPAVFGVDGKGGFDAVLGNPPWERTAFEDLEFFANKAPEILSATTTALRKQFIERLRIAKPGIYEDYVKARREAAGENHFFSDSGRFPLGARGRLNTYALFANLALDLTSTTGRSGIIVETNIATDAPMETFWRFLVESRKLVSIIDFENKEKIFPTVHPEQKFCLLTVAGSARMIDASVIVGFWLHNVEDLRVPTRVFSLPLGVLEVISPNTTQPLLAKTRGDLEAATAIYRRNGILYPGNRKLWRARAWRALMTDNSSKYFRSREDLTGSLMADDGTFISNDQTYLPLLESKLIHQFDYCYATYDGVSARDIRDGNPRPVLPFERSAQFRPTPRFWAERSITEKMFNDKEWQRGWIIGTRDVTNVNNERTAIACVLPRVGLLQPLNAVSCIDARDALTITGAVNSFVVDFIARQRFTGRHLNVTTFSQLPIPSDRDGSILPLVTSRALELTYVGWDLKSFAGDCGYDGRPFRWDEDRRFLLRCELDAAFFHLYLPATSEGGWKPALRAEGAVHDETPEQLAELTKHFPTPRDAVAYIMDTFPIVRSRDVEKYDGDYRTKRVILEIYDAMQDSIRSAKPYQTRLDPPPADPRCCHNNLKLGILAYGSLIHDPGPEIAPKIKFRLKTVTPFPVEYGRYSGKTRGGAPTVVKHDKGAAVAAEILVLDDDVSFEDARDMLWRRERRKEVSRERYVEGKSPNSVFVREVTDNPCVECVLYTDFMSEGKISTPQPEELARRAIQSVREANEGKDGITYLMANLVSGIKTPLTDAYNMQILKQTQTESLEEALRKSKV